MAKRKPQQPKTAKGSRGGVKEGSTPSTPRQKGPKRPVEEEDIFGGAERTSDQRVADVHSEHAKP